MKGIDAMNPGVSLLCKLGSIVIHLQEARSNKRHAYDWVALQTLMDDREVITWLEAMDRMALLPKKREE